MHEDYYKGERGALRFIADITDDYDNACSTQALYDLVDEVRRQALKALVLKDEYDIDTN